MRVLALGLGALAGCTVPEGPLVDLDQLVLAAEDPLEHGDVDCVAGAWRIEEGSLEIDTGLCPHGVFYAPLLLDIAPKTQISTVFWHDLLVGSGEDAQGHLAVLLGDQPLIDYHVEIPSPPHLDEVATAGLRGQPGDRVYVHVHNHGANSWSVLPPAAGRPTAPGSGID